MSVIGCSLSPISKNITINHCNIYGYYEHNYEIIKKT